MTAAAAATNVITNGGIRPADMFLTRALEKMLADKEIKKSQNSQLKKQFELALNDLKRESKVKSSSQYIQVDDVEKYFLPFELACKCKSPRIVETALDCIQKLVAHGYLNESSKISPSSTITKNQLVQRIIKTICQCFEGPDLDDSVQLQIIKCLLTILTSPHIEIHEQTLLLPIKTCYNIQISSSSLINQASARAALTQIINTILSRLETSYVSRKEKEKKEELERKRSQEKFNKPEVAIKISHNDEDNNHNHHHHLQHNQNQPHLNGTNHQTNGHHHHHHQTHHYTGSHETNSRHNTEETISLNESSTNLDNDHLTVNLNELNLNGADNYRQIYMDTLYNYECEYLNFNLNQTVDELNEWEERSNAISDLMVTMLDAICDESSSTSDSFNNSLDAKIINDQIESTSVQHVKQQPNGDLVSSPASANVNVITTQTVKDPELIGIDDPFELDAYLMFRAFCKLSLRPISNEMSSDLKNNIDVKSKILSLQLILATLQNAKSSFKTSVHMINAIKRYLCVSLSKNGVSPINEVFELSIGIFVALMADYKQHLKKQIEVFFREIIIFLLETPTSSFEHKWLVIQSLTHICANAQCVVDLYVNYDCDLQSTNIFARLVNVLSKKAQGRQQVDLSCSPNQLRNLRLKALECVVSMLKCMVEWSKDLFFNPNSVKSNLGPENRPQTDSDTYLDISSTNKIRSYESSNSLNSNNSSTNNPQTQQQQQQSSSSYDPTDLEMLKSKKELWEKGIELFNKKPKKGIQFLQDNELLGRSVDEIATFFLDDDRLDKTAIGDFLGENEKFNKEVMYSYVDQMDFYGMEIVSALRLFLEGFRLPGEAQKIDRLMEKFAARYHELNKKFANLTPLEIQNALKMNHLGENNRIRQLQQLRNGQRLLSSYHFESADTVYVLAFSIIMLATDLHSQQVKKKMTKENYINMNRGINEKKDLPREFLESIFDQISESELKVKGGLPQQQQARRAAAENEKQRRLLYNMEIEQVTQTARSLMESVCHISTNFTSAKYGEHIMPMFKLAWTPFLAAFSIGLQDSDDTRIIDLCLTGFRCAIRIACIFHLDFERDAYVQALSRFTLLTATSALSEMKLKNVECIKALIYIALTDGNYLGKAWYEILKCISQLELAQSIGVVINTQHHHAHSHSHTSPDRLNGSAIQNTLSSTMSNMSSNASSQNQIVRESAILNNNLINSTITNLSSINHVSSTNLEQFNSTGAAQSSSTSSTLDSKTLANIQMQIGETVTQSVVVAVDRIFTGSVKLDGEAIVEFVKWLCHVSEEELASNPPRMYSLQKIVEISYYNMGRIRLQWTRIWNVLGEHFNKAGCNSNEEVAFFAVDSLRQLTMKFLEKGEFANFRFQKDFLKPFEHIMKRNGSFGIRDMVVQCISQMVKSQAQNIKSGWKNIFGVFHLAASQNDERILNYSFDTVSEVIRNMAEKYLASLLDSFQDAIKCLSEFACNSSSPDISIEAIGLIRHCAVFVAEKPDIFLEQSVDDLKNVPESDLVWMKGWFPILFELSCIINRCKLDVRTRGLTVMFEIMKTYGESYRPQWWKELFNIVFRIFDNMKLPEAQIEKTEWMTTTCNHALYAIIDVFTQYYDAVCDILIQDLYTHLKWCIKQDNEQLARSGTNCFENFIISNGVKFSEDIWKQTCSCLSEIFTATTPYDLINWRPESDQLNSNFDPMNNSLEATLINNTVDEPKTPQKGGNIASRPDRLNSLSSGAPNDDKRSKIPRFNKVPDMEHKTFHTLLIKCVVQLELIQTIDNIVFYPTMSKKEDANYIAAAQALSSPTTPSSSMYFNEQLFHDDYGMYVHLTNEQLFLLLDCLQETYDFSCKFNCNHEQRNLLWKAGFKGKDKPNLLKHETQSLACILRILFKMFNDESRKEYLPKIQLRLIKVCQNALHYYTVIPSDSHRESWDNLLLLLFTKLYKLDSVKFKTFTSVLYRQLCDLLTFNLKAELRNMIREIFYQIGNANSIQINSIQ